MTVGDLCDRFLAAANRDGSRETRTIEGYENLVRLHIRPHIGTITLAKLRPIHLTEIYADLLQRGRADGKGGLGATTVRHVHVAVKLILN